MLMTRRSRVQVLNRGLIAESGTIPVGLQLIQTTYSFRPIDKPVTVLREDIHGKKRPVMRIAGTIQEAELQNANFRIYPRPILATAVAGIQEDVSKRAVYGEFDHPPDAKIHLDRISHLMTKVWMDGNQVYGEAEILDSQPHGAMLRGLFESHCQVGMSSRGVGDMEVQERNGQEVHIVAPGFMFVTWDVVAEPSVHTATMQVMESLNRRTAGVRRARRQGMLREERYQELLLAEIRKVFAQKPLRY